MVSKKGSSMPVEEIVKIIIGVGVFIAVLFVLFSLGKIVTSDLREEQAKKTLENLVYEIERLEEGQEKDFLVESPKEWIMVKNPSTEQICFCSGEILKDTKNWQSVDQINFYSSCSSGNMCFKGTDIVLKSGLFSYATGGEQLSSVCYTDYITYPFGNNFIIDNCTFFSFVPMSLEIKNINGGVVVTPQGILQSNRENVLNEIKNNINSLEDGRCFSPNLWDFKEKAIFTSRSAFCILEEPQYESYIIDAFASGMKKMEFCFFVANSNYNISVIGKKSNKKETGHNYYDNIYYSDAISKYNSEESDISICRDGDKIVVEFVNK